MTVEGSRVLVTGASGLIGSHVVRELEAAGYEPVALIHNQESTAGSADQERGDVRDLNALTAAMDGCAAVIHTAAIYSYRRADAAAMVSTNVTGTGNVLEAARRTGVRRVVITSSAATCGPVAGRRACERDQPPGWELKVPYKASKLAAERVALARAAHGPDVVIVNPTTTVGRDDHRPTPSGRMVKDVIGRRIRGYIASGGLNLVAVQDVARGHVLALERGRRGERYLLGGENLTMSALFELIAALAGVPAPRLGIPYPLAFGAAWVAKAITGCLGREATLLILDEVRLARWPMYFTSAKAEAELGYAYRPAVDALAEAVGWFQETSPSAPGRVPIGRARSWFAT